MNKPTHTLPLCLCWSQFVKPEWPMAHVPMRWVDCFKMSLPFRIIFVHSPLCICCLLINCLCNVCADVCDLQCSEPGCCPTSLRAPELRQPWRCSAQGVCCGRQTLLRREALTQELPLRSLWSVCTRPSCPSLPFLSFPFLFLLFLSFPFLSFNFLSLSFLSCLVLFFSKLSFLFRLSSCPVLSRYNCLVLCYVTLSTQIVISLCPQTGRPSSSTATRCPSQSRALISRR